MAIDAKRIIGSMITLAYPLVTHTLAHTLTHTHTHTPTHTHTNTKKLHHLVMAAKFDSVQSQ